MPASPFMPLIPSKPGIPLSPVVPVSPVWPLRGILNHLISDHHLLTIANQNKKRRNLMSYSLYLALLEIHPLLSIQELQEGLYEGLSHL